MKIFSKILTVFLICLFVSLSFNAYACLIPIFGPLQTTAEADCAKPGQEPVSEFCDGFKTLALQSGADVPTPTFSLIVAGDNSSLGPPAAQPAEWVSTSQHAELIFPQKRLTLLSVFRI
jgi:hypothetical protein